MIKYPVKIKNAIRHFLKDTAKHLKITLKDLLRLYDQVQDRDDASKIFSACCVHLEHTDNSKLRILLTLSDRKLVISTLPLEDERYELIFRLIQAAYSKSLSDFLLSKTQPSSVSTIQVLEWDMLFGTPGCYDLNHKCSQCGKYVKTAEAGFICENGHEDTRNTVASADTSNFRSISERPAISWNSSQDKAFKEIFAWYKTSSQSRNPIFRLWGYAGTGKTSMAKEIAWNIESGESGISPGRVLFAAYTGKAASRLLSNGCRDACTLHSLLYRPRIDSETGKVVGFTRNEESPLRTAQLLIVDEVSMVNEEMAIDILAFGVPILCLGDPAQLKPVSGTGYFINAAPDFMLTEIERVAHDNPLLYIASLARKGKKLKPGTYGDSVILPATGDITDEMILEHDQILVGMNRTRKEFNRRYRKLNGYFDKDSVLPVKGDRLICLRNNRDSGLLNGTLWKCSEPIIERIKTLKSPSNPKSGTVETRIKGLRFKVKSLDLFDSEGNPLIVNTICSMHHFDSNLPEPPWREIAGTDEFDFGYALTVHKSQGSEWDSTLVIDESPIFQDSGREWLYTAVTRAANRLTLKLT